MKSMDYMKAYLAAKVSEIEEGNERRQRVPSEVLGRELEEALREDWREALEALTWSGELRMGRTLNDVYIRKGGER